MTDPEQPHQELEQQFNKLMDSLDKITIAVPEGPYTAAQERLISHNVTARLYGAASLSHDAQLYFDPAKWKSQETRNSRMRTANRVVRILKTDDEDDPEAKIKELVVLSAHPWIPANLPEGESINDARIRAARTVADQIEKAVSIKELEREHSDDPFHPNFKPASTEQEKKARAVVLAAIMRVSMSNSSMHEGERLAAQHVKNEPDKMGLKYAPAVVASYNKAAIIVDRVMAKPELADKLPDIMNDFVLPQMN